MADDDMEIESLGPTNALQHAEACLSETARPLCEGQLPKHFWFVGGSIQNVRPWKISNHINIENATLGILMEEVHKQLKLHSSNYNIDGKVETVFLYFAVGIFDLVPDATPVSLLVNLNELVARERKLREELSLYGDVVSNICFATTYPPNMEKMGAGIFGQHAQQFVDLAFRWYNRWTFIINNSNGSGSCHLDTPFRCKNAGRYKLKVGQLADDGILPNANLAKAFENVVDKAIVNLQDMWAKNENLQTVKPDAVLLKRSWHAVKQAEKIYLDAFSGITNASFQHVAMPFVSKKDDEIAVADNTKDQSPTSTECRSSNDNSTILESEIKESADGKNNDFGASDGSLGEAEEAERMDDNKVHTANDQSVDSKVHKDVLQIVNTDNMKMKKTDDVEDDLYLYQRAKKIVELCPIHIQSEALRILQGFKQQEKEILEKRLNEDRLRVSKFQERMQEIKKTDSSDKIRNDKDSQAFSQSIQQGRVNNQQINFQQPLHYGDDGNFSPDTSINRQLRTYGTAEIQRETRCFNSHPKCTPTEGQYQDKRCASPIRQQYQDSRNVSQNHHVGGKSRLHTQNDESSVPRLSSHTSKAPKHRAHTRWDSKNTQHPRVDENLQMSHHQRPSNTNEQRHCNIDQGNIEGPISNQQQSRMPDYKYPHQQQNQLEPQKQSVPSNQVRCVPAHQEQPQHQHKQEMHSTGGQHAAKFQQQKPLDYNNTSLQGKFGQQSQPSPQGQYQQRASQFEADVINRQPEQRHTDDQQHKDRHFGQQNRPGTQMYQQNQSGTQMYQQNQSGTQTYQQNQPGTQKYQQNQPGTQKYQQNQPGTQTYQHSQSGAQTYQHNQPGTQKYQQNQPGTQTYQHNQSGAQTYQHNQPGTQMYQQNQSGTQKYQQNQPGTQTYEHNQSGAQTYQQNQPDTQIYQQNRPSTQTYQQNQPGTQTYQQGTPTYQQNQLDIQTYQRTQPGTQMYQRSQPGPQMYQQQSSNYKNESKQTGNTYNSYQPQSLQLSSTQNQPIRTAATPEQASHGSQQDCGSQRQQVTESKDNHQNPRAEQKQSQHQHKQEIHTASGEHATELQQQKPLDYNNTSLQGKLGQQSQSSPQKQYQQHASQFQTDVTNRQPEQQHTDYQQHKDRDFGQYQPGTQTHQQNHPYTQTYQQNQPGPQMYQHNLPGTQMYQQSQPGTEPNQQNQPGNQMYQQNQPSTQTYQQNQPGTQMYQQQSFNYKNESKQTGNTYNSYQPLSPQLGSTQNQAIHTAPSPEPGSHGSQQDCGSQWQQVTEFKDSHQNPRAEQEQSQHQHKQEMHTAGGQHTTILQQQKTLDYNNTSLQGKLGQQSQSSPQKQYQQHASQFQTDITNRQPEQQHTDYQQHKDKHFGQYQPGTPTHEQNHPYTQTYQQNQPSTQTYQQTQTGAQMYQQNQPGTQMYQQSQPGTETNQHNQPGTQAYQQNQPVNQTYQQNQPDTQMYQQNQLDIQTYQQQSSNCKNKSKQNGTTFDSYQPDSLQLGSTQNQPIYKAPTREQAFHGSQQDRGSQRQRVMESQDSHQNPRAEQTQHQFTQSGNQYSLQSPTNLTTKQYMGFQQQHVVQPVYSQIPSIIESQQQTSTQPEYRLTVQLATMGPVVSESPQSQYSYACTAATTTTTTASTTTAASTTSTTYVTAPQPVPSTFETQTGYDTPDPVAAYWQQVSAYYHKSKAAAEKPAPPPPHSSNPSTT